MSRRRSQTRIKIDSPSTEMIDKILDVLDESFMCLIGPIKDSSDGGYHVFINIREE